LRFFRKAKLWTRLLGAIIALAIINILVAVALLWYSNQTEALFTGVMDEAMTGLVLAEELTTALASQKGYASYYFIDHDPAWIVQINQQADQFERYLQDAMAVDTTGHSRTILMQIGQEFRQYRQSKDLVIERYQAKEYDAGRELHKGVHTHFQQLLDLCNEYVDTKRKQMNLDVGKFQNQVGGLRTTVVAVVTIGIILAGGLVLLLQREVLQPIRQISSEASHGKETVEGQDEIAALGAHVRGLVEHIDHSQAEIERSRSQLMKSEKLAVIGRLAAEVAHTIRGPMTSIGLRLYSLEQAGRFNEEQSEDLQAISDDLSYLDNIIRNFLEFSRAPKLKRSVQSITVILSQCLQLLEHTLEKYKVEVVRKHSTFPLQCKVDSELLKEVFVNLIVNACEAMTDGGTLHISEHFVEDSDVGEAVAIELRDTGPGIDEGVINHLFEPFVTTKDDGTGLGLSISSRIVKEHGGQLKVTSQKGVGATFTVLIPTVRV